jgi:type I restriction enzyme S subunit
MEIRNLTGNLDRSGLNLSIVSDIQIPVPSIAEQEEIALVLITVDKRIELEKEEKMRLGHIRQGLMDLLLNGKIRIKVD